MVITITKGWNTIAWLDKNHTSGTLSITAVKSKNFVDFTGHKNPHRIILALGALSQI